MIKPGRAGLTACGIALALGFVMLIPIPRYVYCPFVVHARDVANVYVDQPGVLTDVYVQPNHYVEKDAALVRLTSADLDFQLAQMDSTALSAELEVQIAERADVQGVEVGMTTVEANAALATAQANWKKKDKDRQRLLIRSPESGFFLAGHRRPVPEPDGSLNTWHGTPLDPGNRGALLDEETVIGQVVSDMDRLKAVLAIDQSEIEFVRNEQEVSLLVYQNPGSIIEATTMEISPAKMQQVPKGLSSRYGGDLVTSQNGSGDDEPMSTTYMVNVPFELNEERSGTIFPGSTGMAKVRTGSQTVGARVWRLVCQTFQFDL